MGVCYCEGNLNLSNVFHGHAAWKLPPLGGSLCRPLPLHHWSLTLLCVSLLESVLLCVDFLCDSQLAMEISVLPSTLWWRRAFVNNNVKDSSKNWAYLTSWNLEFVIYTTILPESFHVFFITTMLRCRKNQCYFYCTMTLGICRLLPPCRERR